VETECDPAKLDKSSGGKTEHCNFCLSVQGLRILELANNLPVLPSSERQRPIRKCTRFEPVQVPPLGGHMSLMLHAGLKPAAKKTLMQTVFGRAQCGT